MTTTRGRPGEVRAAYVQLVDALLASGDAEAAHRCAALAVEQGIWRHPMQRPLHYVPDLTPRAVHDPADFWFCAYLEEHFPLIRAELEAVTEPRESGFLPVEEPLLAAGRWEQVTFYEAGQRFADACARFPVTAAVIEGIPEATVAGAGVVTLSWLYPGTRILPHCGGSNGRLRVHLGVRVPEGARMRVGDETLTWADGRCLVFDDSFEHEVWHDGDHPRVVLLMDVSHPELDAGVRSRMLRGRDSFETRVSRFLRQRGMRRVEVDGNEVRAVLDDGTASQVVRYMRESGGRAAELRGDTLVFDAGAFAGSGEV
ncbi:aspartyl/asparaginyl beta-hydroxylase domain-containing protein [Micromonospora okii]|uniref:aspartyl/asparaginyl beta-hydroxylase domain-containing protein n=1 Tax=Micromonospora okii TaxID=1182970 RepID=UPI001E57392C|nr:aspartyl/asparaginyl beta-hydroxylase domain-containing protein [Micromonospora okii]